MRTSTSTRPTIALLAAAALGAGLLAGTASGALAPPAAASASVPRWHVSLTKTYAHGARVVGVVSFAPKDAIAAVEHNIAEEEGYATPSSCTGTGRRGRRRSTSPRRTRTASRR